jgi:hypothetical protein
VLSRNPGSLGVIGSRRGSSRGGALVAEKLGATPSVFSFYLGLVPVRLAEWLLIVWFFFEYGSIQPSRLAKYTAIGSVWSYVLDIPAALSILVVPGGAWIC